EPTGTTTTRGTNSLSLIATSTLAGCAVGAEVGGVGRVMLSRYTTAVPRSRDGRLSFSRIVTRPVTRPAVPLPSRCSLAPTPPPPPPCAAPRRPITTQLAPTSSATQRIVRLVPRCA